jgi:hypothetical protein
MNWLRHAFAVTPEADQVPTRAQAALVERFCRLIAERGLETPALLFLETARPLNFVSAQALTFLSPVLSALGPPQALDEVAAFLEHRGAVDYLCRRIEELSSELRKCAGQGAPNGPSSADDSPEGSSAGS